MQGFFSLFGVVTEYRILKKHTGIRDPACALDFFQEKDDDMLLTGVINVGSLWHELKVYRHDVQHAQ